ncbi:S-methyl-5'-thioadenosine phosphorylase [Thermocrinis sp.]|uniref:S-methyl-5'-thioadenosine phosphorylase n=1 Tax=Thermocrinis sp. TaxID=2024383 RepID=UPI002FDE8D53
MLAVIGGSGLYKLERLEDVQEVKITTPFGEPSSPILIGKLRGKKVAFLARHGLNHQYSPSLVPYRANLWALKEIGASRVLSISAVGAINERFRPGDFVVIDDFLDFTKGREDTFYQGIYSVDVRGEDKPSELLKNKKVVHVDMSDAYCPQMRRRLMDVLEELKLIYHPSGVYACTEGPRFETPAEIRAIKILGGDVVGMTGYPEVALARELALCYASLCVVANPAAGIAGYRLTSEEVISMMKSKEEEIKLILELLVEMLEDQKTCNCHQALEGAEV